MHATTHKLLAHVKWDREQVKGGIADSEFDQATKEEAARLIEGFFAVVKNGKALDDSIGQATVDAAIYAALAFAHSMKEFVEIVEKREQAKWN